MSAQPGTERRTPNRLAGEQSPYLLQHQWNPVDWHPWGPEAFDKARREDKPVFLSVGYSSCHWCHVMERESFESETIAKLLNENFVSIKVDREERPDVDEIYMRAVQLLTGSGGWPMSVFLTPDQKPFWGGTYFPPDDRGERPGFATVLAALADAHRTQRTEVMNAADRLAAAIRQMGAGEQFVARGPLDRSIYERALQDLVGSYDRHHGGFGGAPKFPPHGALDLLLYATAPGPMAAAAPRGERATAGAPHEDLVKIARGTLDAMAQGGIRDHVGGGFHRYATDAVWLVPHFEKMLYDNAQLAAVYAEAFARWGEPEYRRVAEETLAWVLREMRSPEGGFFSALDADSEGGEGAYYLWSMDEMANVLGAEDGALFARVYGFEKEGNFVDPVTGEEPGNIPHLKRPLGEITREEGMAEEALRARMDRAKAKILERRLARTPPGTDDKVLTSWNGLMLGAFARAGRVLEKKEYVEASVRAAKFIGSTLRRDGRMLRSWRGGEAKLPGYLEDYAFLAWGLLDLQEASRDRAWLDEARSLTESMLDRFWDPEDGGFYYVAADHEPLIARTKDVLDQAVPSGNGMAARVLVRLWLMTGEERYEARAAEMFRRFAGVLENAPRAAESLLLAFVTWSEAKQGGSAMTAAEGAPGGGTSGGASPDATGGETPASSAEPDAKRPVARAQRGPVVASGFLDRIRLAPGERVELRIEIEVEPGWHIQSAKPSLTDLIATSIQLGLSEGLTPGEMRFPDGTLAPLGGERLSVYAGKVVIRVPITAARDVAPGRAPVVARVKFQACDEKRCLKPEQVELSFFLEVV